MTREAAGFRADSRVVDSLGDNFSNRLVLLTSKVAFEYGVTNAFGVAAALSNTTFW